MRADYSCEICGSQESPDTILICEGNHGRCNRLFHWQCLGYANYSVDRLWFCQTCVDKELLTTAVGLNYRQEDVLREQQSHLEFPPEETSLQTELSFPPETTSLQTESSFPPETTSLQMELSDVTEPTPKLSLSQAMLLDPPTLLRGPKKTFPATPSSESSRPFKKPRLPPVLEDHLELWRALKLNLERH
ncbi:MAG: hypothetical protein KVP17_001258 [Porospora cf. gigantea B]|uniref:uncharacterized protein n=1 Tax=Porospora cf. gigantea B TaxID=2853592 RepID=UPI003571F8D5|nr:MAG: hypothetical protein KVP17_001258 [Porospora cf. gigantea B]